MNWFRQNRFLGAFLIVITLCTTGAVWFLFSAKNDWDEAAARFAQDATELNRLERLAPFPSEENVRKMKAHAENYATTFASFKEELKTRVFPVTAMAPNEFQAHLRQAMLALGDKARTHNVKLPANFYLGFDEFASALPETAEAPRLGQELAQIEWLLSTMVDARIERLTSFRRKPSPAEQVFIASSPLSASTGARKPSGAVADNRKLVERKIIETTFLSTPAAARQVINQIAGADSQFFIIRFLHGKNEKEKGPAREVAADTSTEAATSSFAAKPPAAGALNFIVGTERIETSATIEIVRFAF